MQSNSARALLALATVAVLVAAFFIFKDDGDDEAEPSAVVTQSTTTAGGGGGGEPAKAEKPDKPKPPAEPEGTVIVVKNGQPEGGVAELDYTTGDQIQFTVESDVDEGIHVHGYDIEQEVKAGGKSSFDFAAELEGVFEIELENSAVPIAELTVSP